MLETIAGEVGGFMGDQVLDVLQAVLYATIYKLLYYIGCGLLKLVSVFNSMFEVMAGLSPVIYDGDGDYLINVFFSNTAVSKIYWGMALIGIALSFGFAIVAVIRKIFDGSEKEKRSHGLILTGLFKSILIILCMSVVVTAVINGTTVLMQQINYVFATGEDLGKAESITYTEEELAAMARVLNTVGNYSMNPSYDNRYNLNSCFNELRTDMQYLERQGVFDFHYTTTDVEGNDIATWQSALQKIANAASLNKDLKMDVYYESVSTALLDTMELLRVNGSFKPLQYYERQYTTGQEVVPLDRVVFLMSTMRAAKNADYNLNPSMTDNLRGAYYHGEKSIYDLDQVNADFDIGIAATDYIILFLVAWKLLWSLATIILNCVARIFNVLLLYLIAPPVIAVMPMDGGGKFKQWTTAFVVQSFSVFGTVVAMRVILLFLPIVADSSLMIFDNPIANLLAKIVIILGAFEVAEKATALITGILADNAGWQSITAGDMSQTAARAMESGYAYTKKYGKTALSGGLTTAKYGAIGAGIATGGALLAAGFTAYGVGRGVYEGGALLAEKISEKWHEGDAAKAASGGGGAVAGGAAAGAGAAANGAEGVPVPERFAGVQGEAAANNAGGVNKPIPRSIVNQNNGGNEQLPNREIF